RAYAALVSGFDQRLPHWRGRFDSRATGGLHAFKWIRLCRNARRPWCAGRSVRTAAFLLSRLWTRRRVHRALASLAKNLGHRNAGCFWRERAWPNVQAPYSDERTFADRGRIQEQPNKNGGGADAGLHEWDKQLSFKQRGRTVHDPERRMDPVGRAWAGD